MRRGPIPARAQFRVVDDQAQGRAPGQVVLAVALDGLHGDSARAETERELGEGKAGTGGRRPFAAAAASTLFSASPLEIPDLAARAVIRSYQGRSMYSVTGTRPASFGGRPRPGLLAGSAAGLAFSCFGTAFTFASMLSTSRRSDSMQNRSTSTPSASAASRVVAGKLISRAFTR